MVPVLQVAPSGPEWVSVRLDPTHYGIRFHFWRLHDREGVQLLHQRVQVPKLVWIALRSCDRPHRPVSGEGIDDCFTCPTEALEGVGDHLGDELGGVAVEAEGGVGGGGYVRGEVAEGDEFGLGGPIVRGRCTLGRCWCDGHLDIAFRGQSLYRVKIHQWSLDYERILQA